MGTYIARRLLGMIPMLFAISVFVFLMMHAAPGNAFTAILDPRIKNPELVQKAQEHAAGLDRPLPWQYWHWLQLFVTGQFGNSFTLHKPVAQLLAPALENTLILAVTAEIVIILLGIPVGIWQARRPYSRFDYTSSTVLFVLYSVPYYILAFFLIYFFAIKWQLFPAQNAVGTGPGAGSFADHLHHAILPALSLALVSFVVYSRFTRGSMLDVGRQDYVRTAYAKGLRENRVFFKHVFRNAMIPVVTQFGFDIGNLVAGAVILEGLFSYQGMGYLFLQAVYNRDYPVIMATTMIFAVAILIGNLVADVLYAVVDPRIRYN
ncbi:MAG: ABC transporter permease [Alicyclobacillus sp.]|nr:ABC transporter permease [Alicyclobacillus sp.]